MDLLIELVMEIVFEGTFELAAGKRVPMPVRILCGVLVALIYIAGVGVMLLCGVLVIKDGNTVPGIVIMALGVLCGIMAARAFIKKYRENCCGE